MIAAATPTSDPDRVRQDLDRCGMGILRDVLTPQKTADVRKRLFDSIASSEEDDVPTDGSAFDPDERNIRVWHLLNLDPVFAELTRHPTALEFVERLLGPDFLLSNCSANITRPGNQRMELHADQGYVVPPWPAQPLACAICWVLDDMTEENGGTRYIPGSHSNTHGPAPQQVCDTVGVEAPAGSIMVTDGRLWHQTGANTSRDSMRAVLLPYYAQRWIRPQVNWNAVLWPETVAALDPEFLHMLGYYTGNSEFYIPSGRRAPVRPPAHLDVGDTGFKLRPAERTNN